MINLSSKKATFSFAIQFTLLVFLLFILMTIISATDDKKTPSDILRESINKAAGQEIIPAGIKFELTEIQRYVKTSDGGFGHVSVFTGNMKNEAGSKCKLSTLTFFILCLITNFVFN